MKYTVLFLVLTILSYLGIVATFASHGSLVLAFVLLVAELTFGCLMIACVIRGS